LRAEGHRAEVLDGDGIRAFLGDVPRVGMVAQVLARNGVLALVPDTAPTAESLAAVRERHVGSGTLYFEVRVDPAAGTDAEQEAGRVHAVLASQGLV
jgi:adenylylsulfate kinase